jgi:hypothetical protein
LIKFAEIRQNSTDSMVADFSKNGTIHTKIGIVHLQFGEKIKIGQVRFFQPDEFLNTRLKEGTKPLARAALSSAERRRGATSGVAEQGRAACDRDVGEANKWGPWDKIQFKTSNSSNLIRPTHYVPKLQNWNKNTGREDLKR